jgi:hypothetical protein
MQPTCKNLGARLAAIAFDWIDWYDGIAVFGNEESDICLVKHREKGYRANG